MLLSKHINCLFEFWLADRGFIKLKLVAPEANNLLLSLHLLLATNSGYQIIFLNIFVVK